VILGQTLTTDVSGSGSYAASKTHDLVRMDRRASDQRIVASTLQRIVNAFWTLNRYPGEAPKIYMEDGKGLEQDRAARDAELVKAGILKLTDQYLLTHYDYEPGDIAPPDQKTQAAPLPQAGLSALMSAGRASAIKFTPGQQLIEELADHAMSQAPALLTTDQIRKAIAKATSPGHLADLLADMAPKASTAEFSAVMERALFAADVAGYHNAETGRF
jgi:phage gp29-like protein